MSIRLIVRTLGMCLLGAFMISMIATAQTREERNREFVQEIVREKLKITPEQLQQLLQNQGSNAQAEDSEEWLTPGPVEDGVVSADVRPESEIYAAINPTDSNNIVASAMRYGSGTTGLTMPIYYTRDFGKTWNKSSFVTRPNGIGAQVVGGGDPMFAYGPDGTVYFSWIYLSLEGSRYDSLPFTIYWAYSTNGGESWEMETDNTVGSGRISLLGTDPNTEVFDKQWMVVDTTNSPHRGTLYTAMLQATAVGSHIVVRSKGPDDDAFSHVSAIVDDGFFIQVQFASMVVGLSGDVHVTYYGNRGNGPALWHAVSNDGGKTFGPSTMVTPISIPRFSPGQGGQSIPGVDSTRMNPSPQVTFDKSNGPYRGSLYIVWAGNGIDTKLDNGLDIYFSRSTDNGDTWSQPRVVNDDESGLERHQFLPSITVNPLGYVSVTMYDRRHPGENTEDINTSYYVANSFDGGETFAPNILVSSAPTRFNSVGLVNNNFGVGDYTQVVSTSGYVIPFWADGRGGNGDLNIYSAFIPYDLSVQSSVERTSAIAEEFQLMDPVVKPGDISVRFALTEPSEISVTLVDMVGTVVASVPARSFQPGTHTASLDAAAIPSGTYVVVVHSRFGSATRTVFVVK